ncbi:unnamed protein product [Urochloa decumbens]|uniref:Uncharacterized protein n=1 Tax=Urochloa decumbens TaxID=240449 RepID=A0ABC8WLQ5_9POAL
MAGCHKSKKGELGARSLRSLRRSVRLAKIKEASVSEQSEILRLKKEAKVLMKFTAAEEEPQPSAGKKRKKKVIKRTVPMTLIEHMILNPHNPLRGFREERLAIYSPEVREFYFNGKALADKIREYQRALIKQFRKKGYADDYSEVEVTDNEDN